MTDRCFRAQKPFLDACNTWNSDDLMAFQSCTCVLLGNIAVSDDICIDMAQRTSAFESTLHLLQSPATSREVRHAAAGLLRHLARPDDNKELFLKRHVVNACESLILEDDLQMLEAGLALIRQIAQHMPTRQIERSDFVILKTITERCARLDVESSIAAVAVAECARLVVTMARSILRIGSEAEPNDIKWFLETPRLLHCVVEAVRYSEVLFVRSECWFGLALMASRAESAGALSRVLAEDQLIEALERLATAAATPSDEAGGRSNEGAKDRENALFLIHKTLDLEGMDIEERKKTILVELEKTFVKG